MKFTILGEPCGKGRVRFAKGRKPYTPEKTVKYESFVALAYQNAEGKMHDGMISMRLDAYLGIPQSASKKKKAEMRENRIRPTKKPDNSNILKAVEDGLNGIAYKDDKFIVSTHVERWYSDEPRVEVTIEEV